MRLRPALIGVGPAVLIVGVLAQASAAPSFEVASIKADHSAESTMLFQHEPGGRFIASSVSVRLLMQYAFDVNRSRISAAPEWVSSDRFNIAATAGHDVSVDAFPKFVQGLLRDRFHLTYHWHTEERDMFTLVVVSTGKLRPSEPGDCVPNAVEVIPCGGLRNSPGHTAGRKLTGVDLAASLSFFLNAPVLDQTRLPGRYDVDLDWAADSSDTTGPSIFTAVQEQLGLKLEAAKGPVDVLVIDHVERPTED